MPGTVSGVVVPEARVGYISATKSKNNCSPVSRLQSRAWSFACLGSFARRTKKKEILLLVYKKLYYGVVLAM